MQLKNSTKNNGLIGSTGFVGQNLRDQFWFDELYNSKNIEDINGKEFELLVCAGTSGNRRIVNKNPHEDLQNIEKLKKSLRGLKVKNFILISTIEILTPMSAYGSHRFQFELFCQETFPNCLIVRLPLIFGKGLKKNAIYDLIHLQYDWINFKDVYQYYYLNNLWNDINIALENDLKEINLFSEPIKISDIAHDIFNLELKPAHFGSEDGRHHNYFCSNWEIWNKKEGYVYTKEEIYNSIRGYIK